ncbi:MAG TPA: LPS export ABC transporter periplasmic protein LptC [Candidatus Acidoferrum sp.]|nr:LPS export ABC transporter periplasmic protein LptC [Candidatus Acidoferrum sp.]
MRRSEAARYARWSAAVALLLACLTAGVYLKRGWQRIIERKAAPPPAPVNVEKQSSGLTFSKMDGPRKIFTVEASKSTDFKDQNASLLENVIVTIFGKFGDRHDTIHTQSCQYRKGSGGVTCDGDVQIDLESAADAERSAKDHATQPQIVHVETRGVNFDQSTGAATTDQPVTFTFPSGSGDAVGADYNSQAGTLRLRQNVRLKLKPTPKKDTVKKPSTTKAVEEVLVNGTSLDFARDARLLHVLGPAEAVSSSARLTAGEFTLELDDEFRARRLVAIPGSNSQPPKLTYQSGDDTMLVDADKMTALVAPEGWVTRVDGTGSVHGVRHGKEEDDEVHADSGSLDFWSRVNRAKEMNLNGGVFLKARMAKSGDARILQTGAFRMEFSEGKEGQPGKPSSAETLTAGSMEWTDAVAQPNAAPTRTKLQADKLQLAFGEEGKPKRLDATGNVQTERALAGHQLQTATAKNGIAQLLATGGWSQMDLQGDVKLKEADRNAQADHATFLHVGQTAALSGHAVARDATTETHAPRIFFTGTSGDIRAEGGVRSTDFSPNGNAVQLAQVPANITSDTMQGNSKTGRAVYTGHARLWQGDSVLEADSIELLRETKILNAAGKVRAVFPQTPAPAQPATLQSGTQQSPANKTVLWHVSSGTLTYNDITSLAHLEKNVVVQSPDQKIRAPIMDLYFTRGTNNSASSSTSSASGIPSTPGAQQISRAIGTGGVIVDQADRRATAERGEYIASDGKFVMTGGDPTLYDSTEGTTKGRQLTFYLADDTIIVDSENGSRTLTKHRVEK